ncbi:hypothetical protein VTK73DRAFT_8672 [Phialemonium thermophilum]|uniref:non-specific serine/threonine protein kinase n=1 Tax=Phialemonium thermophilum TaxID=223376 RepID=A0ABR3XPC7_9PEZI
MNMSGDRDLGQLMQPVILSMEVDDDDTFESEYRLRVGDQVKYLIISPKTFDRNTLSFPVHSLPHLPYNEDWTVALISRDHDTGSLKTQLLKRPLAGVRCQWHQTRVDVLKLQRTRQLTAKAFEATISSDSAQATVIAKIARFEWEIPRIEQETRAYQLLETSGFTPRFLGHVHEDGRVMGFITEKTEGHPASFQDLDVCQTALQKLHERGLTHGDVNRYNFLVTNGGVKLIDFECLQENASPEAMRKELESLRVELSDESGRGGGFIFQGEFN